jgi:hypothetical protein
MQERAFTPQENRALIGRKLRAVEDLLAAGGLGPAERAGAETERDAYLEMLAQMNCEGRTARAR